MEAINYIKHLNAVFAQFSKDNRLNPTHMSMYMALFQLWNNNFFKAEFYINREEVMMYSKIGAKSTYHRCIKELSHWGYIVYSPSHNPYKGSRIKMFNFGTSSEQALYPSRTEIGTSNGQALVPINKHIQTTTNPKNLIKHGNFKNSKSKKEENLPEVVQYQDNLKINSDKNYDDPL